MLQIGQDKNRRGSVALIISRDQGKTKLLPGMFVSSLNHGWQPHGETEAETLLASKADSFFHRQRRDSGHGIGCHCAVVPEPEWFAGPLILGKATAKRLAILVCNRCSIT